MGLKTEKYNFVEFNIQGLFNMYLASLSVIESFCNKINRIWTDNKRSHEANRCIFPHFEEKLWMSVAFGNAICFGKEH